MWSQFCLMNAVIFLLLVKVHGTVNYPTVAPKVEESDAGIR